MIDDQTPEESARRIGQAGFRARTEGWLRSVERLGGGDDPLGRALSTMPDIDPADLALRAQLSQAWARPTLQGRGQAPETAAKLSSLVTGSTAPSALATGLFDWLGAALDEDWEARCAASAESRPDGADKAAVEDDFYRFLHGRPAALIGVRLIRLGKDSAGSWRADRIAAAVQLLKRIQRIGTFIWTDDETATFARDIAELASGSVPRSKADRRRLLAAVRALADGLAARALLTARPSAMPALANAVADLPGKAAEALVWRLRAAPFQADPNAAPAAIEQLTKLADEADEAEADAVRLCLAQALDSLALEREDDEASCRVLVARVEDLARDREAEESLQRCRATAWLALATACADEKPKDCDAVEMVDRLATAAAHAADPEMQLIRASAWRILAHQQDPDIAAVRAAVDQVEEITSRAEFHDNGLFQLVRATAWRNLAYTLRQQPEASREAALRVEAIVSRPTFAANTNMVFERVQAWRNAATYDGGPRDLCRDAVERVERVASHAAFRDDVLIQGERVRAWICLADVDRDNLPTYRRAVRKVLAITSRDVFKDSAEMQAARGTGWTNQAELEISNPAACRRAVEQVEAVTGRPEYAAALDLQRDRVTAWTSLVISEKHDVVRCGETVAELERIASAEPVADDPRIRFLRSFAWRLLAEAEAERGKDEAVAAAVARVEAIVAGARLPPGENLATSPALNNMLGMQEELRLARALRRPRG